MWAFALPKESVSVLKCLALILLVEFFLLRRALLFFIKITKMKKVNYKLHGMIGCL